MEEESSTKAVSKLERIAPGLPSPLHYNLRHTKVRKNSCHEIELKNFAYPNLLIEILMGRISESENSRRDYSQILNNTVQLGKVC